MSTKPVMTTTNRGFPLIQFADAYDEVCSLQISSLAGEQRYCWLGVNLPSVRKLVPGRGWQDVALPEGAQIASRMHLSQEQVRELLPHLQAFAEHGEFNFDAIAE